MMKFRGLIVALMWLVTLGCMLGGLYFHTGAGASLVRIARGDDTQKLEVAGTRNYLSTDYFKNDNVTSLQLDVAQGDIEITEGEAFSVDYAFRVEPEISVNNGRLIIKSRNKTGLFGFSFGERVHSYLNITIPKGMKLSASSIDLSAGDINITGIMSDGLEIDCSAGNVLISDSVFSGKLSLDSSAGNININNTTGEKVTADLSAGNVNFESSLFSDYYLDCSAGNIMLSGSDYSNYSMDLDTSLGQVKVGGNNMGREYRTTGTAGTIHAESSMGKVEVE